MTIGDYIAAKLTGFGLSYNEVELEALFIVHKANPLQPLDSQSLTTAKMIIVEIIPELLLQPDISQGDFSIKWKTDAIKAYYSFLCQELGLPDKLSESDGSTVQDMSYLW